MKNSDCIFCKIGSGSIPTNKVFENEKVIGFVDMHPQAKKHLLFIHKEHSRDANDMASNDPDQVKDVFVAIKEFTRKDGLDKEGFRIVTNLGAHAGQTVFHTHFHVVGGEQLNGFGR